MHEDSANDSEGLLNYLVAELKERYYEKSKEFLGVELTERTVKWAETAYKNLSEMIGHYTRPISPNTVRSVMTKNFLINKGKLHTLETLSLFLGKSGWTEFEKEAMRNNYGISRHQDKILNTVIKGNLEILAAYRKQPTISTLNLENYFIKDTYFHKKFHDKLIQHAYSQFFLKPGTEFATISATIKLINERKALVLTEEKWDLQWIINGKEVVSEGNPLVKEYVFLLFYNNEDWKIEGKYNVKKSFEDDIVNPNFTEKYFNDPFKYGAEDWYRKFNEDRYIIPF